jgi:hypothetical protein
VATHSKLSGLYGVSTSSSSFTPPSQKNESKLKVAFNFDKGDKSNWQAAVDRTGKIKREQRITNLLGSVGARQSLR